MKSFIILLLLFPQLYFAQCDENSVLKFQNTLVLHYKNKETTPLKGVLYDNFEGLKFYPYSSKYCVAAKFKRIKGEKPFAMKTTSSKTTLYIKYGEINFEIDEKKLTLSIYQNLELARINPKYKNHLFLAFTDLTSGVTSYGGGRYIDFEIPEDGTVIIDFNKAYNPYCAYSPDYSCTLTPQENDLNVAILAGVKFTD